MITAATASIRSSSSHQGVRSVWVSSSFSPSSSATPGNRRRIGAGGTARSSSHSTGSASKRQQQPGRGEAEGPERPHQGTRSSAGRATAAPPRRGASVWWVVDCQPVARASALQPLLALGQPVQVAVAQVAGLQRLVAQRAADAFEDRAPVEGKRLLLRVEHLQQRAPDAAVGRAGQRRLDRGRCRPGSPTRRARAHGAGCPAPRRAVIGGAASPRQRRGQPQQLHLARARRQAAPDRPTRSPPRISRTASASASSRARSGLVGSSRREAKRIEAAVVDPEHHALRRLPFLLAHEMRVRPARAAPVDQPRLVARHRRAVLPELVAHAGPAAAVLAQQHGRRQVLGLRQKRRQRPGKPLGPARAGSAPASLTRRPRPA